jgi:N-methylhydantoinase B
MGAALIRSAYSSNIKERRDCSAALFDGLGRMVAQAEHIPVHLGAMPEAVETVMIRDPQPGDTFLLNDPFSGGTHLPDLTLVSPIFVEDDIIGFSVTRAHHSDVGGMRPGSMPADSREIYQEGLIVPPVRLGRAGAIDEDVLNLVLANSRTPQIRRGDLRAQVAANLLAERRMRALLERWGKEVLLSAFEATLAYVERRTRHAIVSLPDGESRASTELEGDGVVDDDLPIHVRVEVRGDQLTIDFTGTTPEVDGNVNCPLSVTRSACLFALRTLLPSDVPANAGTFAPLRLIAPEKSLLNASPPSAVVAGNVETSQRVADVVLAALSQITEVPASGQGTMNNVVIGGKGWTYYETIGGGQGASASGAGDSGIHVGMTNTRNTPIESLESEFPLRVERYELVYGSGGTGKHAGGDGIVRSLEVLEPASVSILSDRRRHGAPGRNGGRAGAPGRNELNSEELPAKVSLEVEAGDTVAIRTPGGGGYGVDSL